MSEHGPEEPVTTRASPRAASACEHAWCTTEHGATTHPDDEDHRSPGILIPAVARTGVAPDYETEIEVGVLRRRNDAEPWLVIEDGGDVHLEITLDTARALVRAILRDPLLLSALHVPSPGPQQ